MIYYDVTKMGDSRHRSGLVRVSSRLRESLGAAALPVKWNARGRNFVTADFGKRVHVAASDWWLTVELFSETERPGFAEFVAMRACRFAALFHDAIPLRHPDITWPQSVQRHPGYMKLLAGFDRVWAISEASRRDLVEFWRWQGVAPRAHVDVVALGADFDGTARMTHGRIATARPSLLCVGIIEPRKNQLFLLEVAAALWREGLDFDLHIVGRVNPHFGEPIARRLREMAKRERRLRLYAAATDAKLRELYTDATAVVFPTIAEGCGLPLLEALWRGVPCVCSDLPVLRENADGGGCLSARVNDLVDWTKQVRGLLTDAARRSTLGDAARQRALPTWSAAGANLSAAMR